MLFLVGDTKKPAETLEPVLDSIMTAEQYAEIKHDTPYRYTLKSADRELYYFGAPHVRNPVDHLFAEIRTAFDTMDPDIVLVEGIRTKGGKEIVNEKVRSATMDEVIDQAGEAGFALKLASEKGIDWHCPEPEDKDLYAYLLVSGFSRDEIFTWEIISTLPQYLRQVKRQGFQVYIEKPILRFQQDTHWENFDYSYDRAIEMAERILGRSLNPENEPDAQDFTDPIPWKDKQDKQTILNKISGASTQFRDRKIVSDIADILKSHKRVFVVYGASHAAMQEPALQKLFS